MPTVCACVMSWSGYRKLTFHSGLQSDLMFYRSSQALALELEQRIKSLERSSAKSTTWAQQGLPSMQEMSSGAF